MPELPVGWKLFSLVDFLMLLRVYAENYARMIHRVAIASMALSAGAQNVVQNDLIISALGFFDGIKPQLEAAELKMTAAKIEEISLRWKQYHDVQVFAIQCDELLRRLEDELNGRVLLLVPSSVHSMYTAPRKDWEEAIRRFPQIADNVDEMKRCFAFDRYAGSVFHSLLIVEAGLIEFGRRIGVTDPKPGWDATCKKLEEICKAGYAKYAGTIPTIPFNSVEQINQAAQSMKMAWRNKVNHEAGRLVVLDPEFSPQIAEEIILATRSFMRRLATDMPVHPHQTRASQ